jgi:hypothetical protein
MGLDGVELVMAWEDTFGISIDDAEAARLLTTRDVSALIYQQVRTPGREDTGSLALRAFFRLRRGFLAHGVPRKNIRPDAKVSSLLPGKNRRQILNDIRESAGLPRLAPLPFGLQFTLGRIQDMVLDSVIGQHRTLRLPGHGWSLAQVREVIRAVMNAQLQLRKFSDDAEFVKDLKID